MAVHRGAPARGAAVAAGLAAGYLVAVRPRLLRWGATHGEVRWPFPGQDVVPGGRRTATMAATIDAPPEQVWPWLVQMGTDRGGWYSWDRLDDFGRRSADRIHPEWQSAEVGSRMLARPDGSEWWEVVALEPCRFLNLRMSLDLRGRHVDPAGPWPRRYTDSTWGFLLTPLAGGRTRLLVSGYWHLEPRWLQGPLSVLLLEPSHWVMQTRQFAQLRRLAAARNGHPVTSRPAASGGGGPAAR